MIVWYFSGRNPKPGAIVIQYEPPRELSPAMVRYVWKQRFDERAVWALLVDFVSRGLATLESSNGVYHHQTKATCRSERIIEPRGKFPRRRICRVAPEGHSCVPTGTSSLGTLLQTFCATTSCGTRTMVLVEFERGIWRNSFLGIGPARHVPGFCTSPQYRFHGFLCSSDCVDVIVRILPVLSCAATV